MLHLRSRKRGCADSFRSSGHRQGWRPPPVMQDLSAVLVRSGSAGEDTARSIDPYLAR
ncbi:hypothetical protein D779_0568 [Imhoffiella purpurea]|uniref:Uncharacterized protein n=1 Tax=Imhoffiella purpurea TaxID=1249627 RepID=W9V9H4_9GAMM|nr:hypothetical protein D779_0568 [Imhoffiella purpurea]